MDSLPEVPAGEVSPAVEEELPEVPAVSISIVFETFHWLLTDIEKVGRSSSAKRDKSM